MRGPMTVASVASLVSILSLSAHPIGQGQTGSTQERAAPDSDCRAEYQQAMNSLKQMIARMDAADRTHDEQTILAAVAEARRVLASVKAKVAACPGDVATTVTVDPACRDKVDVKAAPNLTYEGTKYVFCSEATKLRFQRDPKRYIREKGR